MYQKHHDKMRNEIIKITKKQEGQILEFYRGFAKTLEVEGYDEKTIKKYNNLLGKDILDLINSNMSLVMRLNLDPEIQLFQAYKSDRTKDMIKGLEILQLDVAELILSGDLYSDGKTLSHRLYRELDKYGREIQKTVTEGLLLGKSEKHLAEDVKKFILHPKDRKIEDRGYKDPTAVARRLARTSISHAYQTSTVKSTQDNPYANSLEWQSALIHGRTCEICADRDGKIYDKRYVPLDHPNGLCTLLPKLNKSLDEIAEELSDWVDGGENSMLDKWYENLVVKRGVV